MNKNVIFNVNKEILASIAEQAADEYADSSLVLAPFSGNASIYAPAKKGKYKGYHRIKVEIWIPEDAIKGEGTLSDFGAFAVLRIPKSRIQDHLVSE
ncbi:hypothetical protein [Paenibacillus chitinolyticus]